jgi:hypothetical protein
VNILYLKTVSGHTTRSGTEAVPPSPNKIIPAKEIGKQNNIEATSGRM